MIVYADLEEAFIGVALRFGWTEPIACYDRQKVIEILMRDGATYEQAEEWFQYNTIGAWFGDGTPVFMEPMTLDEARDLIKETT